MAREYWQIAAGSIGRGYSDRFIQHGIAFVGGKTQVATIDEQVSIGDVLILKRGLSQVLAVGEVVERGGEHKEYKGNGNKEWLRDVDGWDLRAWCYVDWRVPKDPVRIDGLTRTTIQRVPQGKHRSLADSLLLSLPVYRPCPDPEPDPTETHPVDDDQILECLIAEGLRPGAADDLTNTLRACLKTDDFFANL